MTRSLATLAAVSLLLGSAGASVARATVEDPDLAGGIRQVDEGDFEGAVATLEPVIARLSAKGGREAARACLYLGIAQLALGQREAAVGRFREALGHDPSLRLGADRFSPKVLSTFEDARREREAAAARTESRKSHTGRNLLIGGAAAAAAGGVLYAVGRGEDSPSTGAVTFTAARFGTPVLDCPNGTVESPLAVAIDLNAQNSTDGEVRIGAVSAVLIIEVSPAVPSEVGFASTRPATVVPSTLRPGTTALRVQTTLVCANGTGDASRFNEWRGRVTLTAGFAQTVQTADTMRVNLP